MSGSPPIRVCEWSSVDVSDIARSKRIAIQEAAETWGQAVGLDEMPFHFTGAEGNILCTRQYVGVIEVDDISIEILPKLDADSLKQDRPDDRSARRVMDNLLWLLSSSGFLELTEADRASMQRDEVRYLDLYAYLFSKNLLLQLESGLPHAYVAHEEDLHAVRGAINFSDQITRNWNRLDQISCNWDEFTSDTSLNRVLKCAAYQLRRRVGNLAARDLLDECLVYFEDTALLDPSSALRTAHSILWNRANDRFRQCFDLALMLLASEGFQMAHADLNTFVFLLDMNQVFESFVGAVLSATFHVPVKEQGNIGYLLTWPRNSVKQLPDFQWEVGDCHWIGDAKYKQLDAGGRQYWGSESDVVRSGSVYLGPADIRQLTVYAELQRRNTGHDIPPRLAVLYPVVGEGRTAITTRTAWNGSTLVIVPVRVDREGPLAWCTELQATSAVDLISGPRIQM
ncbi:MAG: hypothetical protein PHI93_02815 [Kiritimatiellae bacterium]|jgi:5-methylcytosine-specific restriction enzyme subunit McrC|nr:hypothetical protein [Kiritimatiellia bacterium]MDY0148507.1 hypothetical protein [Kiritimatiellia bacterium]